MNILDRLLGRREGSARQAEARLQSVLLHDRVEISPGKLALLKEDLIDTISKHIAIDAQGVEISLSQDGEEGKITAHIPLAPHQERRR
jgi:cell division topological specificity factor MinE